MLLAGARIPRSRPRHRGWGYPENLFEMRASQIAPHSAANHFWRDAHRAVRRLKLARQWCVRSPRTAAQPSITRSRLLGPRRAIRHRTSARCHLTDRPTGLRPVTIAVLTCVVRWFRVPAFLPPLLKPFLKRLPGPRAWVGVTPPSRLAIARSTFDLPPLGSRSFGIGSGALFGCSLFYYRLRRPPIRLTW